MLTIALFGITLSAIWGMGCSIYFGMHNAEPTPRRLLIAAGPFVAIFASMIAWIILVP